MKMKIEQSSISNRRLEEGKHLFLGLISAEVPKKAVFSWAESYIIQTAPGVVGRIRQARG